jgi:hypothetical protein
MFGKMKTVAMAAVAASALALTAASGAQANYSQFHVGSEANRLNQSGSMAITATSGASRLIVAGGAQLDCATSTAGGSINTGLYANSGTRSVGTVAPQFSNCVGPLGLDFTVSCVATSNLEVTSIPTPFANTVAGRIANISCSVEFPLIDCTALITGSVNGSYVNPATPSTNATLTVFTAGQSLNVVSTECPGIIDPGVANYGSPVGASGIGNITYTVGGAISGQPFFTPTV